MILTSLAIPVKAHTVKTAADVAATFHLEPDHNPKAGAPAQVWFALTRKGGTVIPLDQCDCQLAVYQQASSKPILTPDLTAIDAERYQGIPSAEVIFPDPGSYRLEISGQPKPEADFSPFSLSYDVTVGR